ncbi:MAG: hypothetical protein WCS73_11945 [Lentisphaeria bacterium]
MNHPSVRSAWKRVTQPKLEEKMMLAAEYCEKLITWGYREFLRPCLKNDAKIAYDKYKRYYQATLLQS